MNLQQLEYIIKLAELGHFGKAAVASHVTQPTLSMMIKKLESELDVIIFDRKSNPIVPTAIGRQIIEQARKLVQERDRLLAIVDDTRHSVSGKISIGIIPTLAPYLLPLFIEQFALKYEDLDIHIIELTTEDIIKKLRLEEIDVGLLATPLHHKDIKEEPLFYERFYLYGETNSEQSYVVPQDIDVSKLILLEEGHCLRSQVVKLCEMRERSQGRLNYQIGSMETLINLVDRNQGITVIPQLLVDTMGDEDRFKVTPFSQPQPVREISLVTLSGFVRINLKNALKKEILDSLPVSVSKNEDYKIIEI